MTKTGLGAPVAEPVTVPGVVSWVQCSLEESYERNLNLGENGVLVFAGDVATKKSKEEGALKNRF